MAKITKSQAFTKATIYFDADEARWKILEEGKEYNQTFDLESDVLQNWANVDGVSITIKKDADYTPARIEYETDCIEDEENV